MAVSVSVLFCGVRGGEGTERVERVARRTEVLDGLSTRYGRRVRNLPKAPEPSTSTTA